MTLLRHLTGRVAWLLLGSVAALAVVAKVSRAPGATDSPFRDSWMAVGDKYRGNLRVLSGEVALHLHHEARLAQDTARLAKNLQVAWHQVEGLVTSLDSLHRQPLTPAVRRYAEACGESINNCEERVGTAMQALETEHAKVNLISGRLAGADTVMAKQDTVIANLRRATDCHFLLFKCPNRTTVAGVSVIVGALAALAATH